MPVGTPDYICPEVLQKMNSSDNRGTDIFCNERWIRVRIPNLMATLYYTEHNHIAQTRTQIPTPYFRIGQES